MNQSPPSPDESNTPEPSRDESTDPPQPSDSRASMDRDATSVTGGAAEQEDTDEGPGWLPAVMAATALMGIVGFIVCAFSTWYLFQQRTEFAIRTLRGAYIGEIEQSLLDPETKAAVAAEINALAADLEQGKYENSQAAEIMQGLLRLPVIQWGELQAVEAFLQQSDNKEAEEFLLQVSRLKRAVEQGTVTAMDVDEALEPVRVEDSDSVNGYVLVRPLTDAEVAEVAHRCELVADRESIPSEAFQGDRLEVIVRRAIERAARK